MPYSLEAESRHPSSPTRASLASLPPPASGWIACRHGRKFRALLMAFASAAGVTLALHRWPALETEMFCRGAAQLAGLLTGSLVLRVGQGWELLSPSAPPAVVTVACSGATYFILLTAVLGWHLGWRGRHPVVAAAAAAGCALALTLAINALRIVAVVQARRWLNPLFPDSYGPFLHLLTGVAVFLPALIALNLAFESHGHSRPRSAR
jgi:exosortase/archaeosortase family protein